MTPTPSHIEQIFRDVWQKHRASIIAQAVGKTSETWDEKELPQLVQLLNRHFNEEELKTFTFELGEQYDNLPAQGKEAKARELVAKFFRHGRVTELVEHAMKTRPKVLWDVGASPTIQRPKSVDWEEIVQWEQVDWAGAAQGYSEFIKNTYGMMRVLGQSTPVPLEGIFTDIYILNKRQATQRFSLDDMKELYSRHEPFEQGVKRQPGLEVVRKIQKLFILGKPGAGKTTFLKYLALRASDGELPFLPLFVPLKQWGDSGSSLLRFLEQQLKACHFPPSRQFVEKLLHEGKSLLLLDGLDEVGEDRRGQVIEAIQQISQEYGRNRFVMTCRIAANEYTFTQFTEGEMADFAPPQMEIFAQKWFADDPKKKDLFLAEIKKTEHEGLRELARIPLLLTLLCLGFAETLNFPNRRAEIYEEAIDALLKKWDVSRNIHRDEPYKSLTLGRKRQMLARIASVSFEKGEYFLPKRQLVRQIETYLHGLPDSNPDEIDGEGVLRAIEAQHGILIERAQGIYSFAHLTFQEYFTAKYIVERNKNDTLARLITHLGDSQWREVFLLIASLLDETTLLFDLFLQELSQMVSQQPLIIKLLTWIDQKVKSIYSDEKVTNYRVLYMFLALDVDFTLDLDRTLDLDLTYARTLALDLGIVCTRNPNLAYILDSARALNLTRVLNLAQALDQSIALDFILEYTLLVAGEHYVGELFYEAVKWSAEYPLPKLNQALKKLNIPDAKATERLWQQFCADLRRILQTHRQLGQEWQFTREDVKVLEAYLAGCELVVQCLKLAYVADREGILARLLQPPGEGK